MIGECWVVWTPGISSSKSLTITRNSHIHGSWVPSIQRAAKAAGSRFEAQPKLKLASTKLQRERQCRLDY